jgi:predicted lipoprotein with Yx(FWY)xxD motif
MTMRVRLVVVGMGAVLAGGCGDDGDSPAPTRAAADGETAANRSPAAREASGTRITVRSSRFGRMLFDSRRQAIYIFERDSRNRSACYGACSRAWPPVFTNGRPRADRGVRTSLLGTIRRRGGRLQVTYAGKPLYFYDHEDPGQVLCHNVNLNGGFWWALGPDGKRRP